MQALQWNETLAIGHAVIDQQHKSLFALAQQLVQTLAECGTSLCAHEALTALEQYVDEHFQAEESLIAKTQASALAAHQQQHLSLRMDLENLRGQLASDMPNIGAHVAKWVQHCLIPHIQGADMQALKGVQECKAA